MRNSLEQRVLEHVRESGMVEPGWRVGVAVSGGADSVALLRLLERLRGDLGIALIVVHFDHALRGAESQEDARFVGGLARAGGHEFVFAREDVAAEAARHDWNLEDAARRLRYAFFARVVREGRATRIAVAHTAEDQAETVLAHLIRGTGLTGLAAIYPVAGPVVRPLLATHRLELREYLRGNGQTWREDATNRDLRRLRARIREQLLPQLEHDFSPAIVDRLGELARLAREQEVFWDALVEDRVRRCACENGETLTIGIHDLLFPMGLTDCSQDDAQRSEISSSCRALTERVVRRLYEKVRGDRRELNARHVEQVIHLAGKSISGRHVRLPGAILVERDFDRLVFSRASSEALAALRRRKTEGQENSYQYAVDLPGRGEATVSVPELGRRYRLKVIDWPFKASETKRDAALDADLLRAPLILRNWRPGDAYRPLGRRDVRKLNRMFIAGRVPNRERASWPVLESEGRVIWVRGMPPAHEFCAGEGTRNGLLIEEDRL
jgi:tRNA(Ile)-lysidine synthase